MRDDYPLNPSEDNSESSRRGVLAAAAKRFGPGQSRAYFDNGLWFLDVGSKTYAAYDTVDGFGFRRVD